ncbi:hypothetical protein BC938DRAFT_472693 [Jimgerdemannia flammicorona]|uniref:Uncharacterized protein n=1 Tax=Jimgerdemannia flammicorona TaxID=994334 RepID=A0A433QTS6_9FUNG|nr:hypothetical protein BC938DRAFT_472693 [Jimgerdemannia flammicorona]
MVGGHISMWRLIFVHTLERQVPRVVVLAYRGFGASSCWDLIGQGTSSGGGVVFWKPVKSYSNKEGNEERLACQIIPRGR